MTTLDPKSRSHRQINPNSLLLYFLASLLIHGLALLVITRLERLSETPILRSHSVTKQKQERKPIEFVIVPPEKTADKPPPKTKRRAINNSVAQGKIKSKKSPTTKQQGEVAELKVKPAEAAKPIPPGAPKAKPIKPVQPGPIADSVPAQTAAKLPRAPSVEAAKPIPPVASKAKPIKPVQPGPIADSVPVQTAAKPPSAPSGEPKLSKKTEPNSTVATRLAPKTQSSPSTPTPSNNSSASSLLGGSYQRSIQEDSGSSFFNLEASASREAPYAQIDAQQDELAPYFNEIRRRIKQNWQPESPQQEQLTVLNFAIQRNGQITGLRVAETSGEQQVDRDALEAVRKSAPFDVLPKSFKGDHLKIQFSFNIYIHQEVF